jgi:hypothetical protein
MMGLVSYAYQREGWPTRAPTMATWLRQSFSDAYDVDGIPVSKSGLGLLCLLTTIIWGCLGGGGVPRHCTFCVVCGCPPDRPAR